MADYSKKDVEQLVERLRERHEKLIEVMLGRETERLTAKGMQPGVTVSGEDIRFAVDDVATALKEIRSRLGKS